MSKIYQKYLELKSKDNETMYLFHCGKFYIFVSDDADKINDYVVLKKVPLTTDIFKCGFPDNSLDDYLRVFKNHNLNIEVIEDISVSGDDVSKKIIKEINSIDIDNITPIDALIILKKLKDVINK